METCINCKKDPVISMHKIYDNLYNEIIIRANIKCDCTDLTYPCKNSDNLKFNSIYKNENCEGVTIVGQKGLLRITEIVTHLINKYNERQKQLCFVDDDPFGPMVRL